MRQCVIRGDARWFVVRRAAVAALAVVSFGCAASIAPTAGTALSEAARGIAVGARTAGFFTLGRDSGVTFGAAHEESWSLTRSPSIAADRWQTALSVGYARVPLPQRSRVGYDLHLLGGLGRIVLDDVSRASLTAGARFGIPVRLTRSRELWESEVPIAGTPMLVPELQALAWFPRAGGAWEEPELELNGGVALRLFFWSSLLP